jgi:hypothetical protein
MNQVIATIIVVLGLPTRNADFISYVAAILAKMTGNTYFATPQPSLATVNAALTAFENAETAMGTSKGVKGDRAAKKKALVALLKHLRDYVQSICESNVPSAAAIAESAGMRLKNLTLAPKAIISVVDGLLSGSVVCDGKAVAVDASYYWCYSLDQKSWISVPEQMQAKVTISGLTPGQLYYFRFRALTRKGMGDYCQAINHMVK